MDYETFYIIVMVFSALTFTIWYWFFGDEILN